MSRICLLLAVAMLARAAEQPTLPSQLTLSQALTIALSNSTNIRTAMAQLDEASGRYTQARSTLLPQVEIGARQDYLTVNLVGLGIPIGAANTKLGPFASMSARAFLSQQVLNLADIRAWQSSRSRQDSSRLLVDNAHELVALRVVSAYLKALRAKASRDSLLEQANLANQLYQLTRNRVNQGAAAELDANRAMQQANSLLQQRQEAEHSYVDAKLSLLSAVEHSLVAPFAHCQALPHSDIPHTSGPITIDGKADEAA